MSERSRPSTAMVAKRGGAAVWPVTATLSTPKSWPVFKSQLSSQGAEHRLQGVGVEGFQGLKFFLRRL